MSVPTAGRGAVMTVNGGSSSLKFGVYDGAGQPTEWIGAFEGLEPGGQPRLAPGTDGALPISPLSISSQEDPFDSALRALLEGLTRSGIRLDAVAHRIVHGGELFTQATELGHNELALLEHLNPLAPLHQPHNLAAVHAFARALPEVPQIGCFDTAFHAGMPAVERLLPLPRHLADLGLRRFGFHGLSYQGAVQSLREQQAHIERKAILMHLGNGASACATRGGRSVATSMGFSALDGLMMGTRCGNLDPGVVLHLWREGFTLKQVETMLYSASGLKGVSGISADMRVLRASKEPQAALAVELFTHRIRREAGAMLAVLGGTDLIAFTGGIGEHDARLRADVVDSLGFAGIRIDPQANAQAAGDRILAIHATGSSAQVWVVPSDEGRTAARQALACLARGHTSAHVYEGHPHDTTA